MMTWGTYLAPLPGPHLAKLSAGALYIGARDSRADFLALMPTRARMFDFRIIRTQQINLEDIEHGSSGLNVGKCFRTTCGRGLTISNTQVKTSVTKEIKAKAMYTGIYNRRSHYLFPWIYICNPFARGSCSLYDSPVLQPTNKEFLLSIYPTRVTQRPVESDYDKDGNLAHHAGQRVKSNCSNAKSL